MFQGESHTNLQKIDYICWYMQRNVSIIISNYHSLECLKKVLWGYYTQTYRNFELIVILKKDVQTEVELWIASLKQPAFFPVHLVVSEKQLPIKEIMAVVATDYLVFSEGNCIPRQDFIAQHLQFREQGFWLRGSVDCNPKAVLDQMDQKAIFTGNAFDLKWIKQRGGKLSWWNSRLYKWGWKAEIFRLFTFSKPKLNLQNCSFWKRELRYLEVESPKELETHLSNLKKLRTKNIAYRTTVLSF